VHDRGRVMFTYSRALIYPQLFLKDRSSDSSNDFLSQAESFVTIQMSIVKDEPLTSMPKLSFQS